MLQKKIFASFMTQKLWRFGGFAHIYSAFPWQKFKESHAWYWWANARSTSKKDPKKVKPRTKISLYQLFGKISHGSQLIYPKFAQLIRKRQRPTAPHCSEISLTHTQRVTEQGHPAAAQSYILYSYDALAQQRLGSLHPCATQLTKRSSTS